MSPKATWRTLTRSLGAWDSLWYSIAQAAGTEERERAHHDRAGSAGRMHSRVGHSNKSSLSSPTRIIAGK